MYPIGAKNHEYESRLQHIIRSNDWFMTVLEAVRDCNPPDWFVGSGVVRNIVWDHLHGYTQPTPLADVDVAFFDPDDLTPGRESAVQEQLLNRLPDVPWQAKNQAAVHLWYENVFGYAVPPVQSSEDAIGTWPETATCIGVRLIPHDAVLVAAPLGLDDLFQMILRRNPRRVSVELFRQRLREKAIQQRWPRVRVIDG
jgi:hypothetical protein